MSRPDVTIAAISGKSPRIHSSAFIAPGCRIIGDVEIGPDASVWYNCVIRADVHRIVIGARSNIQDGSVVHCDSPKPKRPEGFPTIIGDDVLIGHLAMVHGCTLEDDALVGMGSIVMNGARIRRGSIVGAGSVITEGKEYPEYSLIIGSPARVIRTLTPEQVTAMGSAAKFYALNGPRFKNGLKKIG